MTIDQFAKTSLFKPLGITEFVWTKDRAGNPHGMAGLQIHAVDLAKLGQLMLNDGVWAGARLLSSDWIHMSTKPGQPYNPTNGLLWWLYYVDLRYYVDRPLLDSWRAAGVSPEYVHLFSDMTSTGPLNRTDWRAAVTKRIPDEKQELEFRNALARAGVMPQRYQADTATAFYASGYLGQYLVVVPSDKIVAVRQIRGDRFERPDDSFSDFTSLVWSLRHPAKATP
jgi:CubicO group peptidase (beta-lactamase class C family)